MTTWVDGMPIPDSRLIPPARRRIWELDFLRGICVLLMVLDHTLFDISYIFGYNWISAGGAAARIAHLAEWYCSWEVRSWVHDVVLWIFCLLTGMSVAFTSNKYLRIAKIATCAVLVSAATTAAEAWWFGGEGFAVRFGVLHMLAVAALYATLLYSATPNKPLLRAGVALGLALGLFLLNALWLRRNTFETSPAWLCIASERMGDLYAFSPGDGFPLMASNFDLASKYSFVCFPYLGRVLVGVGLVGLLYPARRTLIPRLDRAWHRPFTFVGRHTLWVVIIHQLVIVGILACMTGWFITPGDYGL